MNPFEAKNFLSRMISNKKNSGFRMCLKIRISVAELVSTEFDS